MSEPKKSLFSRDITPWLERLGGAGLLVAGVRIILAGGLKTRHADFHGTMGYVAGGTVLCLALLLLRGRIYSTTEARNWTLLDKIAGGLMALGFAACVAARLFTFFHGHK